MNKESLIAIGLLAGSVSAKTATRTDSYGATYDKPFGAEAKDMALVIKSVDFKITQESYDDISLNR